MLYQIFAPDICTRYVCTRYMYKWQLLCSTSHPVPEHFPSSALANPSGLIEGRTDMSVAGTDQRLLVDWLIDWLKAEPIWTILWVVGIIDYWSIGYWWIIAQPIYGYMSVQLLWITRIKTYYRPSEWSEIRLHTQGWGVWKFANLTQIDTVCRQTI